jgi:hypothetical protein
VQRYGGGSLKLRKPERRLLNWVEIDRCDAVRGEIPDATRSANLCESRTPSQQPQPEKQEMMLATVPFSMKPKYGGWIAKSLIFLLSLAVFMEGGARLALSIGRIRNRITGFDNSSYRLQWIRLHRFHREWTGEYAVYLATRGWALKPGIQNMSVFNGKILNSNSKGLRGTTEYGYERTPAKHRIIVLGDSFTFGEEVSDDETYSHYLASSIPSTEVLNLGVQGYGHDQMLLYLKEEGVKYHPDVVMLGFTYLDIYRNLWTFYAYAKPKFELVSGHLQLTNVPVPSPDRVLAEEPYRSKAFDLTVILREKLRWNLGRAETEARGLTSSVLDDIIATARSIGAVPVFVHMPVYEELVLPENNLTGPQTYTPTAAEKEEFIRSYCEERRIACVFLGRRFREEIKKGIDFNAHGHWNPRAHRLAAEELKEFLLRNQELTRSARAGYILH